MIKLTYDTFMAGGNTEEEKNFFQLGYNARREEESPAQNSKEMDRAIARQAQKGILDFLLDANENGKFYWNPDRDGDQPFDSDILIEIYERNAPYL
jgi:hypothetical protein